MVPLTSPKALSKHDVSFIKPRTTSVACAYCRTSNTSRNNCDLWEKRGRMLH